MSDLKPCPFCGDSMDSFSGMSPGAFATATDKTFAVNCDCGAMGAFSKSMEEAVAAWNRRVECVPSGSSVPSTPENA